MKSVQKMLGKWVFLHLMSSKGVFGSQYKNGLKRLARQEEKTITPYNVDRPAMLIIWCRWLQTESPVRCEVVNPIQPCCVHVRIFHFQSQTPPLPKFQQNHRFVGFLCLNSFLTQMDSGRSPSDPFLSFMHNYYRWTEVGASQSNDSPFWRDPEMS